ncbi:GH36-type glycosyl hydrolase domain-containing protein [Rhodothermus bifroesti]|uniref:GH36-type glycosyl hydrolase domain-containing protein n=1 Tax=Rhodothermus bifroesti TaxID=2823335 RepID=UPI001AF018B0|nr:hypothetical protein [Rhodothermus bifroesti]
MLFALPQWLDEANWINRSGWLLRQGKLWSFLGDDGGGGLGWEQMLLTRWHPDPAAPEVGYFFYIRDLETRRYWSAGLRPSGWQPETYTLYQGPECWRLVRQDGGLELMLEVWLCEMMEVRRLRLINHTSCTRHLEVTSYAEPVLADPYVDACHPAFGKLFMQTAALPDGLAVWRRARSPEEPSRTLVHLIYGHEGKLTWETDRRRFLGRGHTLRIPEALSGPFRLSETTGNVLDPILCLRTQIVLRPQGSKELHFGMGMLEDHYALPVHLEQFRCSLTQLGPSRKGQRRKIFAAVQHFRSAPYRSATPEGVGPLPTAPLVYDNGWGGFTETGDAYVVRLRPKTEGTLALPPMPWVNVVANEQAGFIVTERGGGYTWTRNSRTNRLTPWYNDPVADPCGEALYLRDEVVGVYWSPLPAPAPVAAPYEVTHGMGYTRFRHHSQALAQEVCCFVPRGAPVKLICLRLHNQSLQPRLLSVFYVARWVLGETLSDRAGIRTRYSPTNRMILAEKEGRPVAFMACAAPEAAAVWASGDGRSFFGAAGRPEAPEALTHHRHLKARFGDSLDPCAALQVQLSLSPGAQAEVIFLLGEAVSQAEAGRLAQAYSQPEQVAQALAEVQQFWAELRGHLQVQTPCAALNLMANGWLLYQTVSCRLWARSSYYQAGGAFGFRDQLQDAAALVYVRPDWTRQQLLLHAAHQFPEGDVLHWWHPEGLGVRTLFSDDRLWLPYLALHYLQVTGDEALLEVPVPFVQGPLLPPGVTEQIVHPTAGPVASFFEHCLRAIDCSLETGPHGLPLMGSGDWNDGMSRIGIEGRGESVWLGFLLYAVLDGFIPLCKQRGEQERAARYQVHREQLRQALEAAGWDGAWYRRAYFDDGTPLGTREGPACQIDALVQAWAVLSGVASRERAQQAFAAVETYLIDPAARLVRLLTPPFEDMHPHPGYIQGYIPGVRENGGQYTHAALWVVQALARMGQLDRATELLTWISPVTRTKTPDDLGCYQVEPYVLAADIYAEPPHTGRGGWTWYTGSAGWMYRVLLEEIIGFGIEAGRWLTLRLSWPKAWPGYRLTYRHPQSNTEYHIEARREGTQPHVWLDGQALRFASTHVRIPLVQDGASHHVVLTLPVI